MRARTTSLASPARTRSSTRPVSGLAPKSRPKSDFGRDQDRGSGLAIEHLPANAGSAGVGTPTLVVSGEPDRSRHGFGGAEAGLRSAMERAGIEPATSALQRRRSPS